MSERLLALKVCAETVVRTCEGSDAFKHGQGQIIPERIVRACGEALRPPPTAVGRTARLELLRTLNGGVMPTESNEVAARAGQEAGNRVASNFCTPSPNGGKRPDVFPVNVPLGQAHGFKVNFLRSAAGAAAATATAALGWYLFKRPGGGTGTGTGSGSGTGSGGGRVLQFKPRRAPSRPPASEVSAKAARVAVVNGGLLAVLATIASRLAMFTPQGAAAGFSLMVTPTENSSEVY